MKTQHLCLISVATVSMALVTGCSNKNDTPQTRESTPRIDAPAAPSSSANPSMVDRATDAASDTWDNVKDFAYDQRDKFAASVRSMASHFDNEVDSWGGKTSNLKDDQRDAWNKAVAKYRDARAKLDAKLSDLGSATANTWDKAKDGVSDAWDDVKQSFNDLKNKRGS